MHLPEKRARLIAAVWPQSEHVCRGEPPAKTRGGEGMPDPHFFNKKKTKKHVGCGRRIPPIIPPPSHCSHRSLGLPLSTLSPLILGHQNISLFLLLNYLAFDMEIAHINIQGLSGLPLVIHPTTPLLHIESFSGKTKPTLLRDSREHTLRFC